MLLLGRPLGASAARVGGLLSTGQFVAHASAAAAASCRGPFFSFPSPWISSSQETSEERRDIPTHHLQKQDGFGGTLTEVLSLALLRRLPVGGTPHGHRDCVRAGMHVGGPLNRTPIPPPVRSARSTAPRGTHSNRRQKNGTGFHGRPAFIPSSAARSRRRFPSASVNN